MKIPPFQWCLIKTLKQYTNIDPETSKEQGILGTHFISQSAPDNRSKLQELTLGLQTYDPTSDWHFSFITIRTKLRRRQRLNVAVE